MADTDEWVKQINKTARELDAACDATHPSTWPEITAALREKWLKQAREIANHGRY